jgi:hypothetical protein
MSLRCISLAFSDSTHNGIFDIRNVMRELVVSVVWNAQSRGAKLSRETHPLLLLWQIMTDTHALEYLIYFDRNT